MAKQIITLADGIRVEAESTESEVAAGDGKVDTTIESIRPTLLKVIRPVAAAWNELSNEITVEKAEIELGFGFEASGNFFVASTKGNVNLKVKLLVSRSGAAK